MNSKVLRIENLSFSYNTNPILQNINYDMQSGTVCGLIGENGSGKSTLLKIISGLLCSSNATIHYFGKQIDYSDKEQIQSIGCLHEELSLYDNLSISNHLELFSSFYNIPKDESIHRIDILLKLAGLNEEKDNLIEECSYGMKKKLSLILLLLGRPKLLLLDEPFEGVDPFSKERFMLLFQRYRETGGSILFSSHDFSLLQRLCNEILILYKGKIVEKLKVDLGNGISNEYYNHYPRDIFPIEKISWLY